METPARPAPERSRFGRRVAVLMGLVFCAWAAFLFPHVAPYAGGSDSSGYLGSARLLVEGKLTTPIRVVPGAGATTFGETAHIPLGFVAVAGTQKMAPTYPLGFPVHLALASVFGWKYAPAIVNLAALLVSGILTFLLGRQLGLPDLFSAGSVIVLWLCPLTVFSTVQPMSDVLSLAWCLVAIHAALRPAARLKHDLLVGIAVSVAILVRPTNVLLALPIVIAFGIAWRRYAAALIAALPVGLLLLWYNDVLYGAPWLTGYGDAGGVFSVQNMPMTMAHYARWLPTVLGPLVVLVFLAPFLARPGKRPLFVHGAWFICVAVFFATYYHTHETWWYLRFLLPALPSIILLAAAVPATWMAATKNDARRRMAAGLALIALLVTTVAEAQAMRKLGVLLIRDDERTYFQAADWARNNLPPNSAVLALQMSGALHHYTDAIVLRWDLVDGGRIPALHRFLQGAKLPLFAALHDFEREDAQNRIGGKWTKLAKVERTTFWRIDPGIDNR